MRVAMEELQLHDLKNMEAGYIGTHFMGEDKFATRAHRRWKCSRKQVLPSMRML